MKNTWKGQIAMDLGLKNKSVVITGGGSGIGKSLALEFLKEGCRVAICGRSLTKLQNAKEEFLSLGYEVLIQSVDIKDFDALESFADSVETQYGSIDIWVNNAGSNQIKSLMEYDVNEFQKMTEILFVAVFSGCRIAADHMMKQVV